MNVINAWCKNTKLNLGCPSVLDARAFWMPERNCFVRVHCTRMFVQL